MSHDSNQRAGNAIREAADSALQILDWDLPLGGNANRLAALLDDVVRLTPIANSRWSKLSASWRQGEPCVIGRWASPSAAETLLLFLRELRCVIDAEGLRCQLEQYPGAAAGIHGMLMDAMQGHHRFTATDIGAVRAALVRLDAETQHAKHETTDSRIDHICRQLSGKGPAIYRYLASHPAGVTFSNFCDHRDRTTGLRLTESNDPESIAAMLRKLSSKLSQFGERIESKPTQNLIRLSPRK